MLCFRSNKNHKKFNDLIFYASRVGLPTRFLRLVERDVCVTQGSADQYSFLLNQLQLTENVLNGVDTISDSRRGLPDSSSIGTIYHKSLHAYLDVFEKNPNMSTLLIEGQKYYAKRQLKNSEPVSDSWCLYQEAAAGYVVVKSII